jgi:hypothetical protein
MSFHYHNSGNKAKIAERGRRQSHKSHARERKLMEKKIGRRQKDIN